MSERGRRAASTPLTKCSAPREYIGKWVRWRTPAADR